MYYCIYLSAENFAKLSTISFRYLNAVGNLAKDWYHKVCNECQPGDSYSIHVTERISCTFCEIVSTKIYVLS